MSIGRKKFLSPLSQHLLFLSGMLVLASAALVPGCASKTVESSRPEITEEVEKLVEQLKSEDPEQRTQAAIALVDHPAQAANFVQPLVSLLFDEKYNPKLAASMVFQELGAESVDSILELLRSGDLTNYKRACEAIYSMGKEAEPLIPELVIGMNSSEPKMRQAATYAMIPMEELAVPHLDKIVDMLDEKDFRTHVFACRAIIGMGPLAKDAAPRLVELADDGVLSSRSYSYWALGAIGPVEGVDTIELLVTKLDATMQPERDRALRGLGLMGADAKAATEKVRALASDERGNVEPVAALCLWQITGEAEESVELLLNLTENMTHQFTALECLVQMGEDVKSGEAFFIEQLDNHDESIREVAIKCLRNCKTNSMEAIEKIQIIANEDPDMVIRLIAAKALESLK